MSDPTIVFTSEFGEELRRLRIDAGLSLRPFAERIAFDYSYLAQVERGNRAGSAELARQCDEALNAHGHLIRVFADRKALLPTDGDRADA